MVKGFRPNGDMGYVHCALTPPLEIQDPFPNILKECLYNYTQQEPIQSANMMDPTTRCVCKQKTC